MSHRAKACELYTGTLFQKMRRHAEVSYDHYVILSALHGMTLPDTELDPYDFTLIGQTREFRKEWSEKVVGAIKSAYPEVDSISIFAGSQYREFLVPLLESNGYKCDVPLEGLGIGQQLGWLKQREVVR